jgi:ribose-phosphate pyrophosphokinase
MITTAGTIVEASKLVADKGAKRVIAAATHGVMVGPAVQRLAGPSISQVVVSNTLPLGDRVAPLQGKLVELSVGKLLAQAIDRIHRNLSISELFKDGGGRR